MTQVCKSSQAGSTIEDTRGPSESVAVQSHSDMNCFPLPVMPVYEVFSPLS